MTYSNKIIVVFLFFYLCLIQAAIGQTKFDSLYDATNQAILSGKFEKAKQLIHQTLQPCIEIHGKESMPFAYCMATIGSIYYYRQQLDSAIFWQDSALHIIKRVAGENSLDIAYIYADWISVYINMGNYLKSEEYGLESIRIFRLNNHPHEAIALNRLGTLYGDQSLFEKAESMYLRALKRITDAGGKGHRDYYETITNLAGVYDAMDEIGKALPYHLEIKERGYKDIQYPIWLNNYAAVCLKIGLNKEAEIALKKAIEINSTQYPAKSTYGYSPKLNLAEVYITEKKYDKADSIYQHIFECFAEANEKNNLEFGQVLMNWGEVKCLKKEYASADSITQKAIGYIKSTIGENNDLIVDCLINHAKIQEGLGDVTKAIDFYNQALKVCLTYTSPQSLKLASIEANIAVLFEKIQQDTSAFVHYRTARDIFRNQINTTFGALSEERKERFFQKYGAPFFEGLKSFYYRNKDDIEAVGSYFYEDVLFLKNAQLESEKELKRSIYQAVDSSLILSFIALNKERRKIINQSKQLSISEYLKIQTTIDSISDDLAVMSSSFRNMTKNISYSDVQKQLQKSEAAIEFVQCRYRHETWTDSTFYFALVLKKGDKSPQFFYLFEENQLAALFNDRAARSAQHAEQRRYPFDPQFFPQENRYSELYRLVWQPLEKELRGVKKIYYSPDGLLHRVSFPAIVRQPGQLLGDRYALEYLSSTRELAFRSDTLPDISPRSALVFGGIRYTDTTAAQTTSRSTATVCDQKGARGGENRGIPAFLPGTLCEMRRIDSLLRAHGIRSDTLEGEQATEEKIKRFQNDSFPSPDILHIGTHGYYRPRSEKPESEPAPTFRWIDNPMFRSYLLLSGGLKTHLNPEVPIGGYDDGVLTAYEIAMLNLSNTKLVVLSACQTGLGDVRGSEGVYGLQRAFKMAGVKHLLVTLWPVDDAATRFFMEQFYTHWIGHQRDIRTAFRHAQADVRKRQEWADPYFWAGFVLL